MTTMTRSKLGGFPLGTLQVFAPIRLGNVPDCPQGHRPLVCPPIGSPLEVGSSRIRGLFDRKQVNFRHPLVPGGAEPKMLVFGVNLSSAPRPRVRPVESRGARNKRAR